jgi:hypothetical protein
VSQGCLVYYICVIAPSHLLFNVRIEKTIEDAEKEINSLSEKVSRSLGITTSEVRASNAATRWMLVVIHSSLLMTQQKRLNRHGACVNPAPLACAFDGTCPLRSLPVT